MFTLFVRRRKKHSDYVPRGSNTLVSPKRAASLPPVKDPKPEYQSLNFDANNNIKEMIEATGEVPWHEPNPAEYGILGVGSQQNYPQVQKILFNSSSVPALNSKNNEKPEEPGDGDEAGNGLKYFNLRQPHNLTGIFPSKVIIHEKSEEDAMRDQNPLPPTVFQPTSLRPDWR